MNANVFRTLAIVAGVVSVSVSMIYSNVETIYVKPLVHLFLMLFYAAATGRFNVLLVAAFTAVMFGESFISQGFIDNYVPVVGFFLLYFICGVVLLWPVLKETEIKLFSRGVIVPIIGALGISYVVVSVYFMTVEQLPSAWMYVIAIIAFVVFVICCFLVVMFNRDRHSFLLFIAGAGYIFVCVGAMIYELVLQNVILLGLINACEVAAQVAFVSYFVFCHSKNTQSNLF